MKLKETKVQPVNDDAITPVNRIVNQSPIPVVDSSSIESQRYAREPRQFFANIDEGISTSSLSLHDDMPNVNVNSGLLTSRAIKRIETILEERNEGDDGATENLVREINIRRGTTVEHSPRQFPGTPRSLDRWIRSHMSPQAVTESFFENAV